MAEHSRSRVLRSCCLPPVAAQGPSVAHVVSKDADKSAAMNAA